MKIVSRGTIAFRKPTLRELLRSLLPIPSSCSLAIFTPGVISSLTSSPATAIYAKLVPREQAMRRGFLNQKMGKRNSRRAKLQRAKIELERFPDQARKRALPKSKPHGVTDGPG